ncbi:MAG: hypothetical protein KC543_11180 [Myxococcales bacterium]|nr:hypothetical protein [Myxococcales bacterium]
MAKRHHPRRPSDRATVPGPRPDAETIPSPDPSLDQETDRPTRPETTPARPPDTENHEGR